MFQSFKAMDIFNSFGKNGGVTLGGITIYYSEGQRRIRLAGGPSKKQIRTKKSCAPILNNNIEFGFASRLGKSLRQRLGFEWRDLTDSQVSGRLTGLFRNLIKQGVGMRGRRAFSPSTQAHVLLGFEGNRHRAFADVWMPAVVCSNSASGEEYVVASSCLPLRDVSAPAGATHVCFTVFAVAIPDLGYDVARKRYASEQGLSLAACFKERAQSCFQTIALDGTETCMLELRVPNVAAAAPSGSGAMLLLYGVHFYKGDAELGEGMALTIGSVIGL